MATILDQITVGDHLIYSLQEDPRTGSGTPALVGTIAMVNVDDSGTTGVAYLKFGVADTAWRIISTSVTSQISVEPGDFRHLAIYKTDANGDVLNDEFSESGGGTIEVVVAADTGRTADMTYQFPVVPGSITSAEVVLTESDQLINGDKTFNDNVVIQGNLDVNGTLTSIDTNNLTIEDKLVTLNRNGAANSAGGSGLEFEEDGSITGYVKISADREKFCFNVPAVVFDACLDFDKLTASRDFHFPDEAGTLVVQPTTQTGVVRQIAFWTSLNKISNETGVAENSFTWDDTNNFLGIQTPAPQSIVHLFNQAITGTVHPTAVILGKAKLDANLGAGASILGGNSSPNEASGQDSHAQGRNTKATGQSSHAEGSSTQATGQNSHAEGDTSLASGAASHAEGNAALASGAASHAEGFDTGSSGFASHAEGFQTTASGDNSHAEGSVTQATGNNSHAEGDASVASGAASHAEGSQTTASGDNSHAQGHLTIAAGLNSTAIGTKAQTGANDGVMIITDSQDAESTAETANSMKMRFENGWDLVKGNGADNEDGVNFRIRQASATTVDATFTTIQTVPIPANTTVMIKSKIVGVRTGGTAGNAADSAAYERTSVFKNIGGTVTVSKKQSDYTFEDQASWESKHDVNGADAVISVQGAANNNIKWHVTSYVQVVSHLA
jgi:hypothetical protein